MLCITFAVLAVLNLIFFKAKPDEKIVTSLKSIKDSIGDKMGGFTEKVVVKNDQVLDSKKPEEYSIKSSCRMMVTLFSDKLYRFAFFYMLFGFGGLAAQAALLTEIFTSYGVTENDATMFGA